MNTLAFTIEDESVMLRLGAALANSIPEFGLVVYLNGELGAGKTTLVRGFLRALGALQTIKSPTYTLVEPYELGKIKVYHFDLYRLTSPFELETIGVRDYFHEGAILLIEWPQKGASLLREPDLTLNINIIQNGRFVEIKANNNRGNDALQTLARSFTTDSQ